MSANIPSTMLLSELLKPTGYDCPANLQGKTFSESTSGGGSADLEDDHVTTIDVSAYTSPVVVTPTEGKDGMKKNTITLTNIPQAGTTLYAWVFDDAESGNLYYVYTTSATPSVGDDVYSGVEAINTVGKIEKSPTGVREVSGDTITVIGNTHTRDSTKDVVLQAGESGGVTVEPLSVTENGTYTAPVGKAYSPVTVNVPSGGSWHNINDETIPIVDNIINSMNAIVAFRMKISNDYVKGSIMGGDGDGGTTVSACGMKIVDYWDKPANCFFNTGFDIGYTGELTWSAIATTILNAYNTSTGGSDTFTSFEIYY